MDQIDAETAKSLCLWWRCISGWSGLYIWRKSGERIIQMEQKVELETPL